MHRFEDKDWNRDQQFIDISIITTLWVSCMSNVPLLFV